MQESLNKAKLLNIQILKDHNKTEYEHRMTQYNKTIETQRKKKQEKANKILQEKLLQEKQKKEKAQHDSQMNYLLDQENDVEKQTSEQDTKLDELWKKA